ncbi:MAG: tryptophan synthase subunit alpha [Rickettsiales bacterium]|nr:tryptophan synthase subunit alpha [Rickettsiales bacterium]
MGGGATTINRIQNKFAALRSEKRAALIPFIMGYDPDLATSKALLEALPKAGADLIEIGIPFSDPMADGPVIQAAGLRALKAGATLKKILALVADFRTNNQETPIILMGYYNPIYRYGVNQFCKDASDAGVDGVIIVDVPPEEELEVKPCLEGSGLSLIRLIAPTSDDARLSRLMDSATGFVYYISITGITGAATANADELTEKLARIRQKTNLPVAVGFGIKTAEQVKQVAPLADAVVVGSALVSLIEQSGKNAVKAASEFVAELARGTKR